MARETGQEHDHEGEEEDERGPRTERRGCAIRRRGARGKLDGPDAPWRSRGYVTTLRGDKTAGEGGAGRGGGRRTQRGHLHGRRSPSLLSSRQIQHTSSSARDETGRGAGGGRQRTGEREEWGMHASPSSGFVARRGFAGESRGVPSSQMASDLVLRGSAPTMARRSSSSGARSARLGVLSSSGGEARPGTIWKSTGCANDARAHAAGRHARTIARTSRRAKSTEGGTLERVRARRNPVRARQWWARPRVRCSFARDSAVDMTCQPASPDLFLTIRRKCKTSRLFARPFREERR